MTAPSTGGEARPFDQAEVAYRAYCALDRIEHLMGAMTEALDTVRSTSILDRAANPDERTLASLMLTRVDTFTDIVLEAVKAAKADLDAIESNARREG